MSRKLDAVIFGATGFTGKIVVEDAVDLLKDHSWGIAGRSVSKLENVLREVGAKLNRNLSDIPIICADVSDEKSIQDMAKQCKIVLNCCGPYQHFGEIVVKSCIEAGTHHVDISGEPEYIDGMQFKYHELAKEKQTYIISTCAFDSIPSEMGVAFAERKFEGTINSIEMFLENKFEQPDKSSNAVLNAGTWASAIYTIHNLRKVLSLQKKVNEQIECPNFGPKLWIAPFIRTPKFTESYFIPMPFGDCDIVERSQRRLYELENKRPIQFAAYIGFRSLFWALFLPLYTVFIALISLLPFGPKILIKYVSFFTFGRFTHGGPSVPNQEGHTFSMICRAKGWSKDQKLDSPPNKQQFTRVSGTNPFYGLTSVALILTAKTILTESDKMPGSGGVLPPGAAFYKTNLIEELSKHKHGLKFEIAKD